MLAKKYVIISTPGSAYLAFLHGLFINDMICMMIIHIGIKVHVIAVATVKVGGSISLRFKLGH